MSPGEYLADIASGTTGHSDGGENSTSYALTISYANSTATRTISGSPNCSAGTGPSSGRPGHSHRHPDATHGDDRFRILVRRAELDRVCEKVGGVRCLCVKFRRAGFGAALTFYFAYRESAVTWGGAVVFDGDLDAAEAPVDGWEAAIRARAEQAHLLAEQVRGMVGVGTDRDRLVTVSVSSTGALVDIDLDERVGRRSVQETRRRILEAFEAAQTALAREVAKATAETLGMRNPTSDAIVTAFTQRINHLGDGDGAAR